MNGFVVDVRCVVALERQPKGKGKDLEAGLTYG